MSVYRTMFLLHFANKPRGKEPTSEPLIVDWF